MQDLLVKIDRLAGPDGDGRGVYWNEDGVFLGPGVALIEGRGSGAGARTYQVRPAAELERLFSAGYGGPVEVGPAMGRFESIAAAMEKGAWSLAHIHLAHMRLPPLPDAAAARRLVAADRMLKANFDPNEPRESDGKWTTGAGGSAAPKDAPKAGQESGTGAAGDKAPGTAEAKAEGGHVLPEAARAAMGPELTKLVEKYLPIVEELARAAPITGEAFAIHDAAKDLMAAQAAFAAGDTAKGLTLVGSAAVNIALAMPGVGEVGRLVRLCVKAGIRLAKHEGAALLARLFEHKAEALAGAGGGVLAAEGRASGWVLASEGKAGGRAAGVEGGDLGAGGKVGGGEAAAESAGGADNQLRSLFAGGRKPSRDEVIQWAEQQGWTPVHSPTGPLKYVDANGIERVTIKKGSARTPGSDGPHVQLRDKEGRRVDAFGNPVTRKSPRNHTPIE